jgi:hypothetical protein
MRVIAVTQLFILAAAAAADCKIHPELCIEDEVNLLQVKIEKHEQPTKTVTVTQTVTETVVEDEGAGGFTFDTSPVEKAQDDLKAAQSNRSIQMYANSIARLNEAKSIWAATKANMKVKTATLDEINAERAAAAAVQAAQDEADMWAQAMQAHMDAETEDAIAEADYAAKHNITGKALSDLTNATKTRKATEEAAKVTEINMQDVVNDAAAEASANFSYNAKVVAAARVAQQKEAYQTYLTERAAKKAAQKAKWKSQNKARADEWKAAKAASKAQQSAFKAAAQGVTDIMNQYSAQPYSMKNPSASPFVALLQGDAGQEQEARQPVTKTWTVTTPVTKTWTVTTVTTEETEEEEAVDEATAATTLGVDEAVSSEKKTKAAYDVAKYAEKVALRKKNAAQWKSDSAYRKSTHLRFHAAQLARQSRAALEKAKQLAWKLNTANLANASASRLAITAENVTYQTSDASRIATDDVAAKQAELADSVEEVTTLNAETLGNSSLAAAQQAAEDAMVSRIASAYDQANSVNASGELAAANAYLSTVGKEKSAAVSASYKAAGAARHAAWEAQAYDRQAAAKALSPGVLVSTAAADTATVVTEEATQQATLG